MSPFAKIILYGLGVFVIFTTVVVILKLITHHTSQDAEYFGLVSNKDLGLGFIVSVIVTISHEKKKKLKQ